MLSTVDARDYAINATFAQAHPAACVESVIVHGVDATSATVNQIGLPDGLAAAENPPSFTPRDRTVHQQLVLLSPTVGPRDLVVGATLNTGGRSRPLGTVPLHRISYHGTAAVYELGAHKVTCHM